MFSFTSVAAAPLAFVLVFRIGKNNGWMSISRGLLVDEASRGKREFACEEGHVVEHGRFCTQKRGCLFREVLLVPYHLLIFGSRKHGATRMRRWCRSHR